MSKELIDNLVEDLEPVKVLWPSYIRLAIWFSAFFALTALGMYFRQNYRDSLTDILFSPSLHSLSLWLGFIAASVLGYLAFNSVIPGVKNSKWVKYGAFGLLCISVAICLYELTSPALEISPQGMRKFCNLEVILYGVLGSASCYFFLRKGMFRRSGRMLFYLTTANGLIPALIMQTACMYEPVHNILHHIMPILGVAAINVLVALVLKER